MTETGYEELRGVVLEHHRMREPLQVRGSNSKSFYGRESQGETLSLESCTGIVDYQPSELVITVRSGTPLSEITATLAENGQMLGFDPPLFHGRGTIGGACAAGLSGPGRPFSGSVQDFVLGCRILTGEGKIMGFGGKVIKNVAGFDISRLMTGSLGCLAIILEMSLKVIPKPKFEQTIILSHVSQEEAIRFMNEVAGKPVPLSAACWLDGQTRLRLSGSEEGVAAAVSEVGGEIDTGGNAFWDSMRDQTHGFFKGAETVLKGSVRPGTTAVAEDVPQLIDWGGARRWVVDAGGVRDFSDGISANGGHVSVFRGGDRKAEVFPPLNPAIMKIHQRIKDQFDPNRILNPGRMYAEL